MNKIILISTLILCSISVLKAQPFPYGFNYQAVARDGNGNAQQFVPQKIKFTIALSTSTNVATYVETQTVTTNNMGQFNCTVGMGTYLSGVVTTFSNIAWQNNQYNLIVDVWGGASYTNIGNEKLLSVPYALAAPDPTPAGFIGAFGGITSPIGYLICDGSAVSRTTYNRLFAAIGTAYGAGDGSTTFNIPDFRGMFLRGLDGSANNDPDNSTRIVNNTGGNTGNNIGSMELDAFQGHRHGVSSNAAYGGPNNTDSGSLRNGFYVATITILDPISDGTNGTPRTSSETRPKNVNVNYIIKY